MSGNKTILAALAVGAAVGALAIASLRQVIPAAIAQSKSAFGTQTASSLSAESTATLHDIDKSFQSLAEFVAPTVVHIRSESSGGRDVFGQRLGAVGGVGTGVIFRSDGWIVTNDHVVGGFDKVTVELADGRELPGTVRRASESDIAVVKIEATGLQAANFSDSTGVHPGQFVMAVGSPFDLANSVTFGNISAVGRSRFIPDNRMQDNGRFYADLIQTDAAINQGNSGGPLFNIDGQVIGINTAIASTTGGSNGIGFSIPSNFARMLAEMLIEKGKIVRGALGLEPDDLKPYRLKELNLQGGAVVARIPNDSPAAKAGVKQNDVIVRLGTNPVKNQMDLRLAMYKFAPGSTVDVEVVREGKHMNFKVTASDPNDIRKLYGDQQNPNQEDGQNSPSNPDELFNGLPDGDKIKEFFNSPDDTKEVPPIRSGQATLGVQVADITPAARSTYKIPAGVEGAVVEAVTPGSSADRLGMEKGTVIQELNGKKVTSAQGVKDAMKGVQWGQSVRIKYGRFSENGQMTSETDVKLR